MAAKRKGVEDDHSTGVSLAHGGAEHHAKEGHPGHSAGKNVLTFFTAETSSFISEKFKYSHIIVAISSLLWYNYRRFRGGGMLR